MDESSVSERHIFIKRAVTQTLEHDFVKGRGSLVPCPLQFGIVPIVSIAPQWGKDSLSSLKPFLLYLSKRAKKGGPKLGYVKHIKIEGLSDL